MLEELKSCVTTFQFAKFSECPTLESGKNHSELWHHIDKLDTKNGLIASTPEIDPPSGASFFIKTNFVW